MNFICTHKNIDLCICNYRHDDFSFAEGIKNTRLWYGI